MLVQMASVVPLFLIQLLLLLRTVAAAAAAATSTNVLHPGCQEMCGNYSIPYPFGIGRGCYRDPRFEITCEPDPDWQNVTMPFSGNATVFNFSLTRSQATMLMHMSYDCYNQSALQYKQIYSLGLSDSAFAISTDRNKFTAIGCSTVAYIYGMSNLYETGCISFCSKLEDAISGVCKGIGCCQTSLPENLLDYSPGFYRRNREGINRTWEFNPCSYSIVADQDWFKFDVEDLRGSNFWYKYVGGVPLALDWAVENITCEEAKMNSSSYACRSSNSECIFNNSTSGHIGYTCNCSQGYEGNPYLTNGCKDIDECSPENAKQYPCYGICINTAGNYSCSCKMGFSSVDPKSHNCTANPRDSLSIRVKLALGLSIGIISLLVITFPVCMMRQKRNHAEEKQKFYQQNGGVLLFDKLKSEQKSAAFKIYSKEELEKATNNFDKNLILGRGGHGTVFEGTLEKGMIVAIKKSKTIDESQKEEFVKEILLLSQINHTNVVKLLGCCLEVEVPMLVYEFVFNGTLHDYIHNKNNSISLDTRLRIATESAEALAYLHSYASPPILHRDIKSLNILIDQNYVAKVSDFGASILVAMDENQLTAVIQGTLGYLDPEYMQTYVFTEKSDVYSFGVVLLELLTRKKAIYFEGSEEQKNLASNFILSMKQGRLTEFFDDHLMNEDGKVEVLLEISKLAKQCLSIKGEDRPTMKEVAVELQRLRKFVRHPSIQQNSEESKRLLGESSRRDGADNSEYYYSLENRSVLEIELGR